MTEAELQEYIDIVTPRLVEPHQPGSVIANLALTASKDLRGEICFWNDDKFAAYQ
jgi:hypothetical protein